MKKLLLIIALTGLGQLALCQDTTEVRQIQMNLDKYYKQSSTGLRVFGVGCFIAAGTVLGVEQMSGGTKVKKGLYASSVIIGAAGIIIHMEASRHLRNAARVSVSPGSVSLKF